MKRHANDDHSLFPAVRNVAARRRPTLLIWMVALSATIGHFPANPSLANDETVVQFDLPAMVVAQSISQEVAAKPRVGGRFVRLTIPISSYVAPTFDGQIEEYIVEIKSPMRTMRVVDFWPRTETFSRIEGQISIEKQRQTAIDAGVKLGSGNNSFVETGGNIGQKNQSSTKECYLEKPPQQTLTASGTLSRGHGVYYKFRPSLIPDWEGMREIAFLAEVPDDWRGDLLTVKMSAMGREKKQSSLMAQTRTAALSHSQLWVAVHQEGDLAAAALARQFVTQERMLRERAASHQHTVAHKSAPTVWHKIGTALDLVEPRIPKDYLHQVVFGPMNQYLEGNAHRLPIELRIAILDYWEAREAFAQLARPASHSTLHTARSVAQHQSSGPDAS